MRVAIIDDLSLCREEMRKCLYRYLEENYAGEEPVIKEFAGGEEFLSCFVPEVWDIIFIDQYMTGISGIDTARKIRETDRLVALVFVTTSESHAIESYGVRACGYLLKPYLYEDFARTMDLAGLDKVRSARFIRMEEEKSFCMRYFGVTGMNIIFRYIRISAVSCGSVTLSRSLRICLTPIPSF